MERENRDGSFDRSRRRTRRFASEIFSFSDNDCSNSHTNIMEESTMDACEQLKYMSPEQVRELFEKMQLNDNKSSEVNKDTMMQNKTRENQSHTHMASGKENQESSIDILSKKNKKEVTKMKHKPRAEQKNIVLAKTKSSKSEMLNTNTQQNTDIDTDLLKIIPNKKIGTTDSTIDTPKNDNKETKPRKLKTSLKNVQENYSETKGKVQDQTKTKLLSVETKSKIKNKSEVKKSKPTITKSMEETITQETTKQLTTKEIIHKHDKLKIVQATNITNETKVENTNEIRQKTNKASRNVMTNLQESSKKQEHELSKNIIDTKTSSLQSETTTRRNNPESCGTVKLSTPKSEKPSKKVQKNKKLEVPVSDESETTLTKCIKKNITDKEEETKQETDTSGQPKKPCNSTGTSKNTDNRKVKKSQNRLQQKVATINTEEEIPQRVTRSMKKVP